MSMRFVQGLAGAVLAALVTMTWVSGAAAVVPLAACGTLDQFNQTYNVTCTRPAVTAWWWPPIASP
jgi:hypothetical protein